jgi:M6 family metalloprotease-like protein
LFDNRNYLITIFFYLVFISSLLSQDHLKICAIRVEFQTDENNLSTGTGRFMLERNEITSYTVDPPPHNRSYFTDQITAVSNYFLAASKGKLIVSGDVYPLDKTSAYQLEHPMGYYNPNTNEQENNQQLAQLFIDAITLAAQDENIIFSTYDLVTIFHAGVGNDINLGFDETPQDIPSLYISKDFLKKNVGDTFSGIVVDSGNTIIDHGIILPETESQAGFELALTGIFAANIGSYLGMYDLFSPSTKLPGIGRFGLMDSGLFNLFGLAPSLPSAFSRELMGWDTPVLLDKPQNQIPLYRLNNQGNSGSSLLKIMINSDEYYLLEYRGDRDVNIDSLYIVLADGRETLPTYLEVLKTYFEDRIVVSDSTQVLLSLDDYDWGLPGAGILIWHIDQSIINEKREFNAVNDDRNNRAIDLEEADGSQDIGYEYSIVEPGFDSELGTWLDFWFNSNPAPLYKNEFSKSSSPNSRINRNYAESHIRLSGFSDNSGPLMFFDYTRDYFEEGFPVQMSKFENTIYSNPMVGTTDFSGKKAILTSDLMGTIYAVTQGGNGLIYNNKLILARYSGQSMPRMALADTDLDSRYDRLIVSGESGYIDIYQFTDIDSDSLIDTVRTFVVNEQLNTPPIVNDLFFYIGTESGKILRFSLPDGGLDSVYNYSDAIAAFTVISPRSVKVLLKSDTKTDILPIVVDLNSSGSYETVIVPSLDQLLIESEQQSFVISLSDKMISAPSFADLNSDGQFEIIINFRKKLEALNFNGSMVSNFPIVPVLQENESLVGTPLIFDANNDDRPDILVVTSYGQIFAFDLKGHTIAGFPTSMGGEVSLTPVAEDIDDDQKLELLSLSNAGELFSWQLGTLVNAKTLWWNQSTYTPGNNTFIKDRLEPVNTDVVELLPPESVYNYPNPNLQNYTTIRYFLRDDAQVRIKIFDLAGDIVASFDGPGQGNVHNEKRWELTDVSSGVYICRIEANSETASGVKIIKIMVVN